MKYDDASWYYGGDFPAGSPQEYGGTHMALFLRWCFAQGWAGRLHMDEEPDDTRRGSRKPCDDERKGRHETHSAA